MIDGGADVVVVVVFVGDDGVFTMIGSKIFGCGDSVFGVVLRVKMLGDDDDDSNGGDTVGVLGVLYGGLGFMFGTIFSGGNCDSYFRFVSVVRLLRLTLL